MLLNFATLKGNANRSLEKAFKPGLVILLHTSVILLLSLALTALDHLLDQQIGATGGIADIGTRTILMTIQSVLQLTQMVALPFWQIGYTYYVLRVARNQPTGYSNLLQGFRRFFPVLRLKILMALLTIALVFVCAYVSSFIFMMTPLGAPVLQQMEELAASSMSDQELLEAFTLMLQDVTLPVMILFGICFGIGAFFLFYRFRFAELWLMDHPEGRARAALKNSNQLMRGNWKAMLRIDLKFWWFYLLDILVAALCYGDVILDYIGIEMTTGAFGAYVIFFTLYMWAQLALYWWKRNEVSVTYAHAYTALCPEEVNEETATA